MIEMTTEYHVTYLTHLSPVIESPGQVGTILHLMNDNVNVVLRLGPDMQRITCFVLQNIRHQSLAVDGRCMLWFLLDGGHDLQGSFNESVRDVDVEILFGENVNQHVGRLNNLGNVDHQLPGLKQRLPVRVSDVEVVDSWAKRSIDLHLR